MSTCWLNFLAGVNSVATIHVVVFALIGNASAFANPTISTAAARPQPDIFEGKLKGYQLKVGHFN